eukprot:GEMP01054416.1.p1 GENE.GEMP01054416.1~~GEMP01054416.1.p1  ORF type:complete len:169 (+),score=26.34 GEMP01054416.1:557-1063(+)
MSLVDELQKITAEKVDEVVAAIFKTLEQECREVARQGGYSINFDCNRCNKVEESLVDIYTATDLVMAKAQEMGFKAEMVAARFPDRLTIGLSWWRKNEQASSSGKRVDAPPSGNLTGNCTLCQQKSQLAAMVPCGHLCCSPCGRQVRNKICPFCRKQFQSLVPLFNPE